MKIQAVERQNQLGGLTVDQNKFLQKVRISEGESPKATKTRMRTRTKVIKSADQSLIKPQVTLVAVTAAKPKADKRKTTKPKAVEGVEDAEEVDPELAEQWDDGYDDENRKVCQTTAINGPWGLSKTELQRVHYIQTKNQTKNLHYKSAAPMKLFTVRDLRHASLSKHGSFEALYAHLDKKADKASKATITKKANKADRKLVLVHLLGQLGLELRNDSALCYQFINIGEVNGWNEVNISERMAQMRWLHEYTRYSTYIDENRGICRESGERWDAEETRAMAEAEALSRSGDQGEFPAVWPWL